MEKIGLYAPAIVPMILAMSLALGMLHRQGSALVASGIGVAVCIVFSLVLFRQIRKQAQQPKDN